MRLLHQSEIACALFVLMVQTTAGHGTIIFQHSGLIDPALEGFSYRQIGSGGSVGPVENDLGFAAWSTATGAGALNVSYGLVFTSEQLAAITSQKWVLSLCLRVVITDTSAKSYVEVGNGTGAYALRFGANDNGDPFVRIGNDSYTVVDAGSSYNNYRFVYDVASGTAGLWVNGINALQDVQYTAHPGTGYVHWGSGMQGGPAQVNWNLVELSVPEPSATYLIFLGLAGAACLRTVRWKLKRLKSKRLSAI